MDIHRDSQLRTLMVVIGVVLVHTSATDTDECSETPDVCGEYSLCSNATGDFVCYCPVGYYHRLSGRKGCKKVSELVTLTIGLSALFASSLILHVIVTVVVVIRRYRRSQDKARRRNTPVWYDVSRAELMPDVESFKDAHLNDNDDGGNNPSGLRAVLEEEVPAFCQTTGRGVDALDVPEVVYSSNNYEDINPGLFHVEPGGRNATNKPLTERDGGNNTSVENVAPEVKVPVFYRETGPSADVSGRSSSNSYDDFVLGTELSAADEEVAIYSLANSPDLCHSSIYTPLAQSKHGAKQNNT